MDLTRKTFGVVGLAETGLRTCEVLTRRGARVLAFEAKPASEMPALSEALEDLGIPAWFGETEYEGLAECDVIVPSPGVPLQSRVLQAAAARGAEVISEIELAYRLSVAPILAVTGTKGKSTTVSWISDMLTRSQIPHRLGGNIGNALIGVADVARSEEVLVAEVSSFQLEATCLFRPRYAAVLNVRDEHIDRHGSYEAYRATKLKLLANQTLEDYCVLNVDLPETDFLRQHVQAHFFPVSAQQVLAEGAFVHEEGELTVGWSRGHHVLCNVRDLSVPGQHNVWNALVASALAFLAGAAPEAIAESLHAFEGLAHRLETVGEVDGVTFVDDSAATNPASAMAALDACTGPVILIAGGRGKGSDFRPLAKQAAQQAKASVLIGETAEELETLIAEAGGKGVHQVSTLQEAVECAFAMASPGDTVLLSPACASFDMFCNAKDRGQQFKQIVASLGKAAKQR